MTDIRSFRTFPHLRRQWIKTAVMVIVDVAAATIGVSAAVLIRWALGGTYNLLEYASSWPLIAIIPIIFAAHGLYRPVGGNAARDLPRIIGGVSIAFLIAGVAIFIGRQGVVWSRGAFAGGWILTILIIVAARGGLVRLAAHRWWWQFPAIISGDPAFVERISRELNQQPFIGMEPAIKLITLADSQPDGSAGSGTRQALSQASSIQARYLVAPLDQNAHEYVVEAARQADHSIHHVILIPDQRNLPNLWVDALPMANILGLQVRQQLLMPWPRFVKRCLDLTLCIIGGIAILPLIALLMLLVKVSSPGPIFFGHTRVGRKGKHFKAYKFRTMVTDGDSVLEKLLESDPQAKAEWEAERKLKKDPRITAIGQFLRKTSLDELPQVWNVIRGHMSLVGPRPIVDEELPKYGTEANLYLSVRPGITGLWQVSGRNNTTYDKRVHLDSHYVRNWSIWIDVLILYKTCLIVVTGKGAT